MLRASIRCKVHDIQAKVKTAHRDERNDRLETEAAGPTVRVDNTLVVVCLERRLRMKVVIALCAVVRGRAGGRWRRCGWLGGGWGSSGTM